MNTRTQTSRPWQPPHCPNPHCPFHRQPAAWQFRKAGHYRRLRPPYTVQRYQCLHCRKSFSRQTFKTTYWLKRPDLLPWIFKLTTNGMANRQIARALGCAPATVDHQLARLGRHCLLFHRHLLREASPPDDIVADGLESFEFSQFFPFEHLIAVEQGTSFILHFADAPLRRSGRMTPRQKQRRQELEARLGRPDPRAVEHAMREVLEVSLAGATTATLRTDKHQAYRRALRHLACEVEHRTTDSRRRRDRHNEMFEINSLDRFLRHSSANHTRETLAWSKRRQGSSDRLAVFAVWKNCMKQRWELGGRSTPAMLKGLLDAPLPVSELLRERLFRTRIELPPRWAAYYDRLIETPVLGRNRRHELTYAY
ncbi:MAG: hypothetical protein R3D98_01595 [Candidatus Krumholzibacteriia bacterium]